MRPIISKLRIDLHRKSKKSAPNRTLHWVHGAGGILIIVVFLWCVAMVLLEALSQIFKR